MTSEELRDVVLEALSDRKAERVAVLDVRSLTDFTDFMIIASGRSGRQVTAIAEHAIESAKSEGQRPMGIEGLAQGEWVLVDLCDIVLHIMQAETREFYQLEKLWGDAERGFDGAGQRRGSV